ncbi:MAPEG family protein [Solimicrobium silvestre]|uniref:MAPEG family n=1 Tax=Solimicrobium silvestre TaxID=2099400 RepID=A0A2S9H183_9BURK|nr:MAPEG family protein [Solimicrobium silvestre]PRC93741.1 MAPEG family [Solimicrobium silvestre]
MKLTAWATLASVLMYIWVFAKVGKARGVHKVPAPLTDGPVEFLIALRVQANTVEQLIIFLPLLWLCCIFMSDQIAAILGAIWVVGRILYALGYYQAPDKRSLGFLISSVAAIGLLISAVTGLIIH